MRQNDQMQKDLFEFVVKINRTAKVVKGGRRFSFNALVVAGNKAGSVGIGFGKANEVPSAVDKAYKKAAKRQLRIPIKGTSIPHQVLGRFGASKILLIPASPGTGIIACAAVRAIFEALGITDILTKSFGSPNPINLVRATLSGLQQMRSRTDIEALRGVRLTELDDKERAYEKAVAIAIERREKVEAFQRERDEEKQKKLDEARKRKDNRGKHRSGGRGGDRRDSQGGHGSQGAQSDDKGQGKSFGDGASRRPALRKRPGAPATPKAPEADKPADAKAPEPKKEDKPATPENKPEDKKE